MNTQSNYHFFTGSLLAVLILTVFIFLPFLTPVVLAITLAIIFGPLHRFISKIFFKGKEQSIFCSLITLLIIVVVVFVPGLFISFKLYSEVENMYYFLTEEAGRSSVISFFNSISQWLSHTFFDVYSPYSFDSLNITEYLQSGLEWLFSNIDTLFTSTAKIFLGIFMTFLSLFYFLKDGKDMKNELINLSPLNNTDSERIIKRLEQTIYSIVVGSLIVSVVQGILTGIGFAIFHIPNPVFWGSITAISALIPGIGTSLILVPAVLYLFFIGSTSYAIGLLVWGLLAVGIIDNILGPIIINKGIKIHPLFILLSVLGGITLFGAVGFILGPLSIVLLFALLEIYKTSRSQIQ